MKQLFEKAKKAMELGKNLMFLTIISSSGSTPRDSGTRMIVIEDGQCLGTIGGGTIEFQSIQYAKQWIAEKKSCKKAFSLAEGKELGMVCGGDVIVYFQYIDSENKVFAQLCDVILDACEREEDGWFILDLTDETDWSAGFYSKTTGLVGMNSEQTDKLLSNRAKIVNTGTKQYYSEPLIHAGKVYVFGGGHVAQQLVPLLSYIGFRCTVFDDRPEFANRQLFPDAKETIVGDFQSIFESVTIEPHDYVCIMSRGHEYDYQLQRQMLQTDAHYIGVMGSRRKIATITRKLLADGFTEEDMKRFYTPIGLEIYAQTPAEIAVSIAAELIRIRAIREGRKK